MNSRCQFDRLDVECRRQNDTNQRNQTVNQRLTDVIINRQLPEWPKAAVASSHEYSRSFIVDRIQVGRDPSSLGSIGGINCDDAGSPNDEPVS